MKKATFSLLILCAAFAACNNNPAKQKAQETKEPKAEQSVNNTKAVLADSKMSTTFQNYLGLKDALVKSDSTNAAKHATALVADLKSINGCENTASIAGKIGAAKDLKTQRKDFTLLSADLIGLFKHANLKSGSIYVQYCPMANDGEGGYWLANEKQILNPYYGDEMLNCGRVAEEIKKK